MLNLFCNLKILSIEQLKAENLKVMGMLNDLTELYLMSTSELKGVKNSTSLFLKCRKTLKFISNFITTKDLVRAEICMAKRRSRLLQKEKKYIKR